MVEERFFFHCRLKDGTTKNLLTKSLVFFFWSSSMKLLILNVKFKVIDSFFFKFEVINSEF